MPTITSISDTHNRHRKIPKEWLPKTDWIMHSGDISGLGKIEEVEDFLDWFSNVGEYKYRIFCAGNHDKLFETNPYIAKSIIPKNVIYLEDSGIEIDKLKIWGSPVSPTFGYGWAFNRDRGEEIKKHWNIIPNDIDILLVHTPPYKIGTLGMLLNGENVGCEELTKKLSDLKNIKLLQTGHIHEGRGYFRFADGQLFINASLLNRSYDMVNKPYILDTNGWKLIYD